MWAVGAEPGSDPFLIRGPGWVASECFFTLCPARVKGETKGHHGRYDASEPFIGPSSFVLSAYILVYTIAQDCQDCSPYLLPPLPHLTFLDAHPKCLEPSANTFSAPPVSTQILN